MPDPQNFFSVGEYLRHNSRRLEHLTSLGLDIAGRDVLELGAGIGDHTGYFVDRGCAVTCVEGREENLQVLRRRFPAVTALALDLNGERLPDLGRFAVVYAYGVLYHLAEPARAIARMAQWCHGLLLLETCVSLGDGAAINPLVEPADNPTQALSGIGCRPTRRWVFEALTAEFAHVYLPATQPWHEEFPLEWAANVTSAPYTRAIFVASRQPLDNQLLLEKLPDRQRRGP
jgi:SAM-dependent methyltransferase